MDHEEIKKIEKFVQGEKGKALEPIYDRIVILADSKGNYTRTEEEQVNTGRAEVEWWNKKSRQTKEGVKYLEDNLKKIRDGKKTKVLFWHFTCDLTIRRSDGLIYKRHQNKEQLLANIRPYLDILRGIHRSEEHIDIGLLEAPPIYTRDWHKKYDGPHWEAIDDEELLSQIAHLNGVIRTYNEEFAYRSPRFECDFVHRRKNRRKGSQTVKKTYELRSVLLKDGVHPIGIVALKWLIKIIQSTQKHYEY